MVIDFLDKNLEDLKNICKQKKFSLKTILMIADQLVKLYFLFNKDFKNRILPLEKYNS